MNGPHHKTVYTSYSNIVFIFAGKIVCVYSNLDLFCVDLSSPFSRSDFAIFAYYDIQSLNKSEPEPKSCFLPAVYLSRELVPDNLQFYRHETMPMPREKISPWAASCHTKGYLMARVNVESLDSLYFCKELAKPCKSINQTLNILTLFFKPAFAVRLQRQVPLRVRTKQKSELNFNCL